MKTKLNSSFVIRYSSFAVLAALALCLAALPAHAQTYWGNALSFNGANSYLSIGAAPLTNSWTAEFWVNRLNSTNTAAALLDDGITSLRLEQFNGTKRVGFTKYGVEDYTFNYTAPTNTWVYLAFVSDTTHTCLYVNGVAQDTNANTIALPLRQFGAVTNGARAASSAVKGTIDEIRVWNAARSAADIQGDMFQSLTGAEPGLVACYHFDEGSGLIAHDATTNHFDATLVNGPTWVVSTVPFPFTYTTNNGTITVTGYTGPGGVVAIPATINRLQVTSVGGYAFFQCVGLTSITIPNSITSIGEWAFWNCAGLTSVTIPDGVATIGDAAFAWCTSLTNITISDGVTSIGEVAFQGCTSLTSIMIPESVTSIGTAVFMSCGSLGAITVDTNNPAYSSVDGVLFNRSQTALIQFPGARAGSYAIPDSVTTIEIDAFTACAAITNVTIPDSVTAIEDIAFDSCSGLTSVTIGKGVTSIGSGAFQRCNNLTEVYFRGNASGDGSDTSVFNGDGNATLYYVPGTTGWVTPFDGCAAVLWNAQAQTGDGNFGVRTNQFGFTITGTTNIPIVVDACTNLACPAWTPLQTCCVTNGSLYFCDPQWTNYPAHFYRVRWP